MTKMTVFLVALFFTGISVAYAGATGGAASVEKVETANHSSGQADKGLDTAESHIAAQHGKAKAEGKEAHKVERAERTAKAERPTRPERPAR